MSVDIMKPFPGQHQYQAQRGFVITDGLGLIELWKMCFVLSQLKLGSFKTNFPKL
jgi:hypothetical protein